MSRPKGANNVAYRNVDRPLLLKIHELILDHGLNTWAATIRVAAAAFGLEEGRPHDDRNVRRLREKYGREKVRIAAEVERRRNPQRTLSPRESMQKAIRDREAFLAISDSRDREEFERQANQTAALIRVLSRTPPE